MYERMPSVYQTQCQIHCVQCDDQCITAYQLLQVLGGDPKICMQLASYIDRSPHDYRKGSIGMASYTLVRIVDVSLVKCCW